ncbi:hypothetical protein BDB00DRAFT_877267 [Zychaea mexicana]|uniref:uncharacterized protein n=1 Tax=Zychaea mexicana TaxID=64656 RepID=UPI0022FE8C65|nr:uncharacterized protein BDB00DRAFT_877267 [Zychaea mexicana]KAI9488582.1 hypothetical protein BDB00DRAFT_877267 [Zychaea mexicana]
MPGDSLYDDEVDSVNEGTDDDVPDNNNLTVCLSKKECPFCDKTYTRFMKAQLHIYQQHQKEVEARDIQL